MERNYDSESVVGWLRFQLPEHLDGKDLRWIWYKDFTIENNISNGSKILFKAGQKAFKQQLNKYIEW